MKPPRHSQKRPQPQGGALALAIERSDWERASQMILLALVRAARSAPPGTIDDVLALLSMPMPFGEEDGHAEVRS